MQSNASALQFGQAEQQLNVASHSEAVQIVHIHSLLNLPLSALYKSQLSSHRCCSFLLSPSSGPWFTSLFSSYPLCFLICFIVPLSVFPSSEAYNINKKMVLYYIRLYCKATVIFLLSLPLCFCSWLCFPIF